MRAMYRAQCHTIRTKLFKIGAIVKATCRQVWVRLASACPSARLFMDAFTRLQALAPLPG